MRRVWQHARVARQTVKLLLVDELDRLLLIHSRDPVDGRECWYPVGGGIEPGESARQAAVRDAAEETGLTDLSAGAQVWTRDHTYTYGSRRVEVHEEWSLHRVEHFEPAPTALSEHEARAVQGFRWWDLADLATTSDTVFPPRLAHHLSRLLSDGPPSVPLDISE